MHDLVGPLRAWRADGTPFAIATVVDVQGSAPRGPGSSVAVAADGSVVGSLSGGCVEGAVYELAREVLETGAPRSETYGYSDDDAFAVGLTCGGVLDVFVRPVSAPIADALDAIERGERIALATVHRGPEHLLGAAVVVRADRVTGSLGDETLDLSVIADARAMLRLGLTGAREYAGDGRCPGADIGVFVQSFTPSPRMLVFGAIDFAGALARVGKLLGYHVTVCDARPIFATKRRFPDADDVVVDWPHRYLANTLVDDRTVVCVLTHDAKFDVPVLRVALRSPARYVGAMGSRRTHSERLDRLRAAGLTEAELARLRSPIGLDIGAATPEETAVSIAAEIIAQGTGRDGLPLGETSGDIRGTRQTPQWESA